MLRAAVKAVPSIDDAAFAAAFDRFAEARVVLLGEASHGTSEFYRARGAITRRLIERHGFSAVAVEADWPDVAAVGESFLDAPPGHPSRPDSYQALRHQIGHKRFLLDLRESHQHAARWVLGQPRLERLSA